MHNFVHTLTEILDIVTAGQNRTNAQPGTVVSEDMCIYFVPAPYRSM